MDLDAILSRKPEFAIVDELAHTNISGSRHLKRYQDVLAPLAAKISVITAVNIQHLESAAPIVKRFTGARVIETIPDSLLAEADEIVDLDASLDELRQPLYEGKIYPIEQVSLALRNFFKPSNLALLRELSLREVARDICSQREELEPLKGGLAQLARGGRVLVCLPWEQHRAEELLCGGWREAAHRDAEWSAVDVETGDESVRKIQYC